MYYEKIGYDDVRLIINNVFNSWKIHLCNSRFAWVRKTNDNWLKLKQKIVILFVYFNVWCTTVLVSSTR